MKSFVGRSTALVAVLVAGHATPARAATSVSPDFQLPLQCMTTWYATTYSGHGHAIDLNLANGASDRGQPVVAAAAGKVTRVTPSTGEVLISHGGGWATRYLHMSGIRVAEHGKVSAGQWIGAVDDIGRSEGSHLHFEVLRDGAKVVPVIDSVAIHPPTTITSKNCLPGRNGHRFVNQMLRAPDGTVDYVTAGGERYWVPNRSVLSCLQATGAPLHNVTLAQFTSLPRNEYGDPAGRPATCATAWTGWMIRGSSSAVWYVTATGFRLHVPREAIVMCLGGWSSVRPVSDSVLATVPGNPFHMKADCNSPLHGRMIKAREDRVDYVDVRGRRHHVPNSDVVSCLGGSRSVVHVRNARRDALVENPRRSLATCDSPLVHRMIRKSSGQVDYLIGNLTRYWVPNNSVVGCLGGWASVVNVSTERFDRLRRNANGDTATCDTRWFA